MLIDVDLVRVSPGTVYSVMQKTGLISAANRKPSKKRAGFVRSLRPHEHWHIEVIYVNLGGSFYYLCAILGCFSRYIVHWKRRKSMKERKIELIEEYAREKFPGHIARMTSDSGPQFVAKDFKS